MKNQRDPAKYEDLLPGKCDVCERCWIDSQGRCIYGGPWLGYYHQTLKVDQEDHKPQQ